MLISDNGVLERGWWTYGKIKYYLVPIKKNGLVNLYDIEDVIVVEKLNENGILVQYKPRLKSGSEHRLDNLAELIEYNLKQNINIHLIYKKASKYVKQIKNRYYADAKKEYNPANAVLAHIRHTCTDYNTIIYEKLSWIKNSDVNTVVKKLKNRINKAILTQYPKLRRGRKK